LPNILTRVILFLSSYAPLMLILVIRDSFQSRPAAIGLVVVAAVSVLGLFVYLRLAAAFAAVPVTVSAVMSRDGHAMGYITSYLLPFLNVGFRDPWNAVSLGVVFVVLCILYVNSNLIHTNPILNLCGFHIFEIETAEKTKAAVISRRAHIRTGSTLGAVPLGDYVLMEKSG